MSFSAIKLRHIRTVLLCLLFSAGPVYAFNANAHRVVGHIAAAHACVETLAAVHRLDEHRELAAAGVWADEIRGDAHMDFVKPWHYINVPDAMSVTEFVASQSRSRKGDVLSAIERFTHELGDTSRDDAARLRAYRFLVHFVADVHQPLHVGRRSDQGGNRIRVRVDGRRTRLHSFWDGFDLNRAMAKPRDYAAYLSQRFSAADVNLGGGPLIWAQESKDYRSQVYALAAADAPNSRSLSDEYRDNANDIINLRMYQAGRRLAALLDNIFCSKAVKR